MADDGILLTEEALDRISDAVDYVERVAPGATRHRAAARASGAIVVAPVRVSGPLDVPTNWYPGFIRRHNSDDTYSDVTACWVRGANNEGLQQQDYSKGRLAKIHTDGLALYVVDAGGASPCCCCGSTSTSGTSGTGGGTTAGSTTGTATVGDGTVGGVVPAPGPIPWGGVFPGPQPRPLPDCPQGSVYDTATGRCITTYPGGVDSQLGRFGPRTHPASNFAGENGPGAHGGSAILSAIGILDAGAIGNVPTSDGNGKYVSTPPPAASAGWVKITKTFTDFSAAAINKTITLRAFAAKETLQAVVIKTSTNFQGGGITTYTLDVGDLAGTMPGHVTSYNAFAAVSNANFAVGVDTGTANKSWNEPVFTPTNLSIKATCDGGHLLNAATAGVIDVWLLVGTLP